MLTWEDKRYWLTADEIARNAFDQLFYQISSRGTNVFTDICPLQMNYVNDVCSDTMMTVDFSHTIVTDKNNFHDLYDPDNMGLCLATDDYCEIEIITFLPKYYRVKKLISEPSFRQDFLNVIRHEIEHMFQDGAYKLDEIDLLTYDRSDINFLLDPAEVPAYVHGFRISTRSLDNFKFTIKDFIEAHGKSLCLSKKEIKYTYEVWLKFLNNLGYAW